MTAEDFVLAWIRALSENESWVASFFTETGFTPACLRDLGDDKELLQGTLDYLLSKEDLLLAFCEREFLNPRELIALRAKLAPFDREILGGAPF